MGHPSQPKHTRRRDEYLYAADVPVKKLLLRATFFSDDWTSRLVSLAGYATTAGWQTPPSALHVCCVGNVPSELEAGDGSVIIGATDAHGNTILNYPLAAGRGAQAAPGSTAIGAGAGAGLGTKPKITNKMVVYEGLKLGSKILDVIKPF